jgi:hypothetical protein
MYIFELVIVPVLLMIVCVQLWAIAQRLDTLISVAKEGQK